MLFLKGKGGKLGVALCGLFVIVLLVFNRGIAEQKAVGEDFSHHFTAGVGYIDQHQYEKAITELKQALQIEPDNLPALINLGLAYHHHYEYEKAIEIFQKVLHRKPDEPYSYFNLGYIYLMKGDQPKAEHAFRKVVEIDPQSTAAHYNLGSVYLREGKYQEAIAEFQKAIKLVPNLVSAYYGLARAFMKLKKPQQAHQALLQYQKLRKEGNISDEMERYFKEGKYLSPLEPEKVSFPAKPVKVEFVDVTQKAGLEFKQIQEKRANHLARRALQLVESRTPSPVALSEYTPLLKAEIAKAMGSGAGFFDYNNDGYPDLYVVSSSVNRLYRNNGDGTFTDVTRQAGVGDSHIGLDCIFGDYNGDGYQDIYVTNYGPNVLYRNNGDGTFTDVTRQAGVGDPSFSTGAAFWDYDHDGDLDIYVANYVDLHSKPQKDPFLFPSDLSGQPNRVYRNNGNGTFTDVTAQLGLSGGKSRSLGVVCADFDNDRDVDLFVVNDGQPNLLYRNDRNGIFTEIAPQAGVADSSGTRSVCVGDWDGDGWPDLFVTNREAEKSVLYRNNRDDTFSPQRLGISPTAHCWGAALFDYDNDGDLDLFVATSSPLVGQPERYLFYQNQQGNFELIPSIFLKLPGGLPGRGVALADYDNDGDIDIFVSNNQSSPRLLQNEGGNQNNWLNVQLLGTASNKDGLSSKIEVRTGPFWQEREVASGSGYLSGSPPRIHFGLSGQKRVDLLRVRWARGIVQTLISPEINQTVKITETPTVLASCPTFYTWNGSCYTFISDLLGNGVVGYLLAPGSYNPPDPDEYVKVESEQLKPKDGYYKIQFLEQLGEMAFLDQAKLLVIDHPSDVEVYPNERFQVFPPFPKPRIVVAKDARPPIWAVDDKGNDILPLIAKKDGEFPANFKLLTFRGFAEPHSIILNLGDLSGAKQIWLICYGWVDYSMSSDDLAAAQAGIELNPPSLQVINSQGKWQTVIKDMGFPAGLPKYMTLNLTGKFLTSDYRVKITTNMPVYWDQILVSTFSEDVPLRVTTLLPSHADLHWRGYPKLTSAGERKPFRYDYQQIDQASSWPGVPGRYQWESPVGYYTRYGNVTSLLQQVDDMYVIMNHGDEITIEFDANFVPNLPQGWSRDFFFYANGYNKDVDINSACSATVTPLPFHQMSRYPYPSTEHYPLDLEHIKYLEEYNTRWVSYPVAWRKRELEREVGR